MNRLPRMWGGTKKNPIRLFTTDELESILRSNLYVLNKEEKSKLRTLIAHYKLEEMIPLIVVIGVAAIILREIRVK